MSNLKGLKSPADPSKIILKGTFETFDHSFMKFAVKKCDEALLPEGDKCLATNDEKYIKFWESHSFGLMAVKNFVNYNAVKIDKNPIEQMLVLIEGGPIDTSKTEVIRY